MNHYNAFEEAIAHENREYLWEDMAQTNALMEAAQLVFEAMEEQGLNQTQLAKRAGVSKSYISRILSGHENMSIRQVARILHILGKDYKQQMINRSPNHNNENNGSDALRGSEIKGRSTEDPALIKNTY